MKRPAPERNNKKKGGTILNFAKLSNKSKKSPVPRDFIAQNRKKKKKLEKRINFLVPSLVIVSFIICGLSLYKPIKAYVQVQQKVNYEKKVAKDAAEQLAKKQNELKRWNDPKYVESQIRDRLSYVKKGETPYVVISPKDSTK